LAKLIVEHRIHTSLCWYHRTQHWDETLPPRCAASTRPFIRGPGSEYPENACFPRRSHVSIRVAHAQCEPMPPRTFSDARHHQIVVSSFQPSFISIVTSCRNLPELWPDFSLLSTVIWIIKDSQRLEKWCGRRGLNPHGPFKPCGFSCRLRLSPLGRGTFGELTPGFAVWTFPSPSPGRSGA
jgi:hypothetical protein